VAALNRLQLAGEAALESLTAAHPEWVAQRVCAPDELTIAYALDGYAPLEAVYDSAAPGWLRELPGVENTIRQAASHGAWRARYRGAPKTPCRTW
jgi:hypothetical protein